MARPRRSSSHSKESHDEGDRIFDSESLAAELGLGAPSAPPELGPPVDRDRLLDWVQGRLSEDEAHEIAALVASFAPWHAAWVEVHRESEGAK